MWKKLAEHCKKFWEFVAFFPKSPLTMLDIIDIIQVSQAGANGIFAAKCEVWQGGCPGSLNIRDVVLRVKTSYFIFWRS